MRLTIGGMHRRQHARSAHSALLAIPGVQSVDVLLEHGEAWVYYDPEKLIPQRFEVALFVMRFTLKTLLEAPSDSTSRAPAHQIEPSVQAPQPDSGDL